MRSDVTGLPPATRLERLVHGFLDENATQLMTPHPFTLMNRVPPVNPATVQPRSTMATTLPTYDPQTQKWSYMGHALIPTDQLLYDPQIKRLMPTGYIPDQDNPENYPGKPDPANFRVYLSTYDLPAAKYSDADTNPLIPIKYQSPLLTPTKDTTAKVVNFMRQQFPTPLKHNSHTDPDTGEVLVVSTNDDGWPSCTQGAGPIALKLDANGVTMTRKEIAATLAEAGLTVA